MAVKCLDYIVDVRTAAFGNGFQTTDAAGIPESLSVDARVVQVFIQQLKPVADALPDVGNGQGVFIVGLLLAGVALAPDRTSRGLADAVAPDALLAHVRPGLVTAGPVADSLRTKESHRPAAPRITTW